MIMLRCVGKVHLQCKHIEHTSEWGKCNAISQIEASIIKEFSCFSCWHQWECSFCFQLADYNAKHILASIIMIIFISLTSFLSSLLQPQCLHSWHHTVCFIHLQHHFLLLESREWCLMMMILPCYHSSDDWLTTILN